MSFNVLIDRCPLNHCSTPAMIDKAMILYKKGIVNMEANPAHRIAKTRLAINMVLLFSSRRCWICSHSACFLAAFSVSFFILYAFFFDLTIYIYFLIFYYFF